MIITSLTDSPVLKSQWHAQIPGIGVFFCFFPEEAPCRTLGVDLGLGPPRF